MKIENYGNDIKVYIKLLRTIYMDGKYEDYEDEVLKKMTNIDKQILEEIYIKEVLIKDLSKRLGIKDATCRKRAQVLRMKLIKELKEKR